MGLSIGYVYVRSHDMQSQAHCSNGAVSTNRRQTTQAGVRFRSNINNVVFLITSPNKVQGLQHARQPRWSPRGAALGVKGMAWMAWTLDAGILITRTLLTCSSTSVHMRKPCIYVPDRYVCRKLTTYASLVADGLVRRRVSTPPGSGLGCDLSTIMGGWLAASSVTNMGQL